MKLFLKSILLFIIPILLLLAPASYVFYVCIKPFQIGDLEKLGGLVIHRSSIDESYPKIDEIHYTDIAQLYNEYTKEIKVTQSKIANFGDSASNKKEFGYVNYLGYYTGENILNASSIKGGHNQFNNAISMLNNGYLKDSNIETVIIECGERYIIDKVIRSNIDADWSPTSIVEEFYIAEQETEKNIISYIREVINWLLLKVKTNPTKVVRLNTPMFSHGDDKLYFYYQDLNLLTASDATIEAVKQQLININKLFADQNIKLVVISVPDKYDVYQEYIIDNKHGAKTIMEQLSNIDEIQDFYFDTKESVMQLINDGVKDVYLYNDTHWSSIAAKAAAEDLSSFI